MSLPGYPYGCAWRSFDWLAAVLIVVTLYGCGGTTCPPGGCLVTAPIKVESNNFVFSPAFRLGVDLADSQQPEQPHTGHAVEFGIAYASGNGRQYIAGNEQVVLNSDFIVGPQNLRNEFGMYYADLSYRWRKFPWERTLGVELSGGIGFPTLDLAVSAPAQQASGSFSSSGIQGGVGIIWRLNPQASIQARMAGFSTTDIMHVEPGVNAMLRYELSYAKKLGRNLTLRAGYANWAIYGYGNGSDFQLHSAGPSLVLAWDFNDRVSRSRAEPEHQPEAFEQRSPDPPDRDKPGHEPSEPPPAMTSGTTAFITGPYAILGVGQVNFANSPVSSDPYGFTIRLGGGYNFNSHAGMEICYSTGSATAKYNDGSGYSSTNMMDYSTAHIAAVAIYPYTDQFSVFAKMGLANIALDHSYSSTFASGSGNGNKTNIMLGLGWKLSIGQHFGVRVQYEDFGQTPLIVNYGSMPYDVRVQVFTASGFYLF